MNDGVNAQAGEPERSGEEGSGGGRGEPSGVRSEPTRAADQIGSVDLADKDQPAEGGREQAEEDEPRS